MNRDTALRALIFDVDGTLADTEHAHLRAFNEAFAQAGMGWHWDEGLYTQLLEVSGGKERMLHFWKQSRPDVVEVQGGALRDTLARLHEFKTAAYEAQVRDGAVTLRPGVLELLMQAHDGGLQLAIATTTSPANIAALLRKAIGPDWKTYFRAIGDASSAPLKKPHPQVYRQMLAALDLPAQACLAFEDSGNGLLAATLAGIATVVTPTRFTAHHAFGTALKVLPDLRGVQVSDLRAWHRAALSPSTARSA